MKTIKIVQSTEELWAVYQFLIATEGEFAQVTRDAYKKWALSSEYERGPIAHQLGLYYVGVPAMCHVMDDFGSLVCASADGLVKIALMYIESADGIH